MTHRITSLDLSPFYRNSVGIDRFMENALGRVQHANAGNYPPFNIISVDDDTYAIEVAIAGFTEEDIKVTSENGRLIIEGTIICDEAVNMLHHGISSKDFVRTFELADFIEVQGATVVSGILKVDLKRIVPEALKPKQIDVKFKK